MGSSVIVRLGQVEDVPAIARVHVVSWQETYRGLMSDQLLDNPGFIAARERFWTAALTDERFAQNRIAVAEHEGDVIGIAMSGPPQDTDASWSVQLYVIYVLAANFGSGAGSALLNAVIDSRDTAALWVADPNPRAQAFYRGHGFMPDEAVKIEDGVREIRLVRAGPGKPSPK